MDIEVVEGDITEVAVDVIVNAANNSLLGGGGVDGAIHAAAGPSLLEDCKELRQQEQYRDGLPTGQAVHTGAGELPAEWVIHTVGPIYGSDPRQEELLASCYMKSLDLAERLGAGSIAFPAISTGVYRYPVGEAARIAAAAIRSSQAELDKVLLVCFDNRTAAAFLKALNEAS